MATPMHGSPVPGGNHRQADLEDELAADGLDLTPVRDEVDIPGLTAPDALEGRSELAIYLLPSAFPASRATLIEVAQGQEAPTEMLERLGRLPRRTYHTVEEVWEALGGPSESRTFEREPEPAPPAPIEPGPAPRPTPAVVAAPMPTEERPAPGWVDAIATCAGRATERAVRVLLGGPVHLAVATGHRLRRR